MGGGGKGGGGSTPFVAPTYTDPITGKSFDNAQALNDSIDQRTAKEATTSAVATDTSAADTAAKEAEFQQRAASAKENATNNINAYFTGQGLSPDQYAGDIARTVNTASGHVTDLMPDPSGAYAPAMGSDLVNELTSGKQTRNLAQFNSDFDPAYSQEVLPDSMLSPATSSVLKQQFDPLSAQLSNAQKRHTLNDTGYQAALKSLSDAQTGATATVNKLGQGVLASDRNALDTYLGQGRTAAGSAPLSTDFSTDPYVSGARSKVDNYTANFGGDVQNAVGNTKFSDITQLLNAGGAVQGAHDPTVANPNGAVGSGGQSIGGGGDLSPSYLAQQAIAQQKRGLGTTGAF